MATPLDAIAYAQRAEYYGSIAGSRLLQVTALRTQAAALNYADRERQALQVALQAQSLLEERDKQDKQKHKSVAQPAEEPIPHIVHSYVYAGLATYQAYDGRKEDALLSLKKAHTTFSQQAAEEQAPVWVDHHIGNLLINDGEAYTHLGMYKSALDSLKPIDTQYAQDTTVSLTNRVNALTSQIMAEVNRDEQPRDMEWCIEQWEKAMRGAKMLKSNLRYKAAVQAYTAMRAAWPGEKSIKDLREHIQHW